VIAGVEPTRPDAPERGPVHRPGLRRRPRAWEADTTRWVVGRPSRGWPVICCHGVTSFLPTGGVRAARRPVPLRRRRSGLMPVARADVAEPLGSNLEGPWLAHARKAPTTPRSCGVRLTCASRPGGPPRRPPAGDGRTGTAGALDFIACCTDAVSRRRWSLPHPRSMRRALGIPPADLDDPSVQRDDGVDHRRGLVVRP